MLLTLRYEFDVSKVNYMYYLLVKLWLGITIYVSDTINWKSFDILSIFRRGSTIDITINLHVTNVQPGNVNVIKDK